MSIDDAAHRLATRLRPYPWYRRTTTLFVPITRVRDYVAIRVWGEGDRPDEVPATFEGIPVEWCRVSGREPCPFGGVR